MSGFVYPDGKRYYTFDSFLKQKFGCKIAKLSLNGGFTCPNRDGTKGVGGCIYCSNKLSGDFAGDPKTSIAEQLAYGKALVAENGSTSNIWRTFKPEQVRMRRQSVCVPYMKPRLPERMLYPSALPHVLMRLHPMCTTFCPRLPNARF